MKNENEIITLEIYNDFVTATFIKEKLAENEIDSFLEDENVVGLNPIGGVELKIFAQDLKRAREILAAE
ncbi:hypothetical protein LBMAG27_00150 [Bacteroidota bacterium]|nr:hypothetical protein LBMAG27_00150 [Bacteroidota bacterium]